jgi:hypothetical protein
MFSKEMLLVCTNDCTCEALCLLFVTITVFKDGFNYVTKDMEVKPSKFLSVSNHHKSRKTQTNFYNAIALPAHLYGS